MRELQVTVKHTPTIIKATERYVSEEPYKRNGGRSKKGYELYAPDDESPQAKENKRCSISNSKSTFKGIIHANYYYHFCMLTLTFDPTCNFNIQDFITCRDKFDLFWRSLKRCEKLAEVDLRYVGAIEFQKNDNIHFHILCRIPKQYKKLLQSKWKYGGLHYEESFGKAEDSPKIANYLTKGIYDERLPTGKKRFLGGYGLDRPTVIKFNTPKIIDYMVDRNGEILTQHENEYGYKLTSLQSDVTADELQSLAEVQDESLYIKQLTQLASIQYTHEGAF